MTYKEQLIKALQEGILLLVKYGFIIAAIIYCMGFVYSTRDMAVNGNNAAAALNQYIAKGWLPQINNGVIPEKPKEEIKDEKITP